MKHTTSIPLTTEQVKDLLTNIRDTDSPKVRIIHSENLDNLWVQEIRISEEGEIQVFVCEEYELD